MEIGAAKTKLTSFQLYDILEILVVRDFFYTHDNFDKLISASSINAVWCWEIRIYPCISWHSRDHQSYILQYTAL